MKNTTKLDIALRKEQLEQQLKKITVYEGLRKVLLEKIQWDYMAYHEADEEHDGVWFTEPEKDSWKYDEYLVSMEILEALDSTM